MNQRLNVTAPLRWLITGAAGMLGSDLRQLLTDQGEQLVALDRSELDITDSTAVNACINDHSPSIIVNCAAYTAVDRAEEEEGLATAINGSAVEHLAAAANAVNALLVQVSTDFVFDGSSERPYEVTDATAPVSAYGRSKLVGEINAATARKHLIVRTSWLFGENGPSFVAAIRNQIAKGTNPLRVVSDQRGRPTYTPHLAAALIRLGRLEDARGIFHYADEGECSWYDLAQAIVEESGASVDVVPVTTGEFPRPARRPAYSVLSTERYERVTGVAPASWREGLGELLELRIEN
ncbi:MAG TPA: dTDP-4-dehydrorhamnose reductase [Thermoanaerobaculia bacterium]